MISKSWTALRDDLVGKLPGVVSAWRSLARELGLKETRIDWGGPIETVAWRVLEEADKQGCPPESVRRAAHHVIASSHETIAVNAASADRAASAVRAMRAVFKLGEAAREALYAQGDVLGDLAAARAKIEEARRLLGVAEDELDTLG